MSTGRMIVSQCDRCGKIMEKENKVLFYLTVNDEYGYQIHAQYCKKCRKQILRKISKKMEKVAGF
jgi:hypothetical protein